MTHSLRFARIAFLSLACLLISQSALAQGFWATKPFNQWSDDELKKFMNDSPWVKKVEVVRSTGPETQDFLNIMIAWETALPVKWASVRTRMGKPGDVPAEAAQFLEQAADSYTIRLSGLPADMVASIQAAGPQAAVGTVLKVGKREILINGLAMAAAAATSAGRGGAENPSADTGGGGGGRGGRGGGGGAAAGGAGGGRSGRGGGGADFLLRFSKEKPITLEEGDNVEVIVKFGQFKVQKAFKLKDMVISGKLAL